MFATNDEQVLLRDLVEITAGPSGSMLDRLSSDPDGVPVISPSDITDRHSVDARNLRRLPREYAARLTRFALRDGDTLIVRQGSLGRLAYIRRWRETWLYNSSCIRIRPISPRIIPEYLPLYLSFPPVQEGLLSRAVPGTVQSLNSTILGELLIAVPSIRQQRKLISLIMDIDDLVLAHKNTTDHLQTLRLAILDDFLGGV